MSDSVDINYHATKTVGSWSISGNHPPKNMDEKRAMLILHEKANFTQNCT